MWQQEQGAKVDGGGSKRGGGEGPPIPPPIITFCITNLFKAFDIIVFDPTYIASTLGDSCSKNTHIHVSLANCLGCICIHSDKKKSIWMEVLIKRFHQQLQTTGNQTRI